MKYSIFIAQDNSRYLGFKNILLKLKDWGFLVFLYIKTSRQKNIFVHMNENCNDSHHQKTTCTVLYIQRQKIAKRLYIYKNPDTLQKVRQFALRFY